MIKFSDYIVFIDESGSPDFSDTLQSYPVFILTACIFHKDSYLKSVIDPLSSLKLKWFGHDGVIFRSYDIRKAIPPFSFMGFDDLSSKFVTDMNKFISQANFTQISIAIDPIALKKRYKSPADVYELSLKLLMERIFMFLQTKTNLQFITPFLVEGRGRKEDLALELAFRRIQDGDNYKGWGMPMFQIEFSNKRSSSAGLQLADLCSWPIGKYVLSGMKTHPSFEIIKSKLYKDTRGNFIGYGLKCFPQKNVGDGNPNPNTDQDDS